jgi:chemotaxis protein MotA
MKDTATLVGLLVGFGGLLTGYLMEGGSLLGLVSISALFIILGGTLGATIISYTLKDVFNIPKLIRRAMFVPVSKEEDMIVTVISLAEKARREGLLILEEDIGELEQQKLNPILPKGLQLVVDGTDPDTIRSILGNEIYNLEFRHKHDAGMFMAAGGFSPTMGIIGTVMGLVNVLKNIDNPSTLGPAIAMAFLATLYGITFANLIWIPIANKLTLIAKKEKLQQELLVEGILAIQQGENPAIIKERLICFIEESKRKAFTEQDRR